MRTQGSDASGRGAGARRWPAAAALAALALAVPGVASSQGEGPVVTPAAQAVHDGRANRNHSYQQVLVDPTDDDVVVLAEQDLTTSVGRCLVHVSFDGGRTWASRRTEPKPERYGSCARPTFGSPFDARFASDGTLFVLAAGSETASNRGPTDVYLARSEDLGVSWDFTVIASGADEFEFTKADGTKQKDVARYNRLRLAVHPTDPDRVYAGIMVGAGTPGVEGLPLRSLVAVSTDGGRTFGRPVDILGRVPHTEIYGSDVPALAVDRKGTIYAFTKERPPNPPPPPRPAGAPSAPAVAPAPAPAAPTTKGAGCPALPRNAPATPPTTERVPETPPRLGQAGAGDRLLFAKSTDGGRTWQARSIDDGVAVCRFCLTTPEAAVDARTGDVYVVFESSLSPPPTPRDDRDIWFMRSADGGRTFSARMRLNDGLDPNRKPDYNQLFPGISVAPDGRIDVAWYDFRTDTGYHPDGRGWSNLAGETCWDVFYTYSEDGGRTWAKNVRVSDRSMNKDEGFALNVAYDIRGPMGIASTDDETHIAWGDSRAGHFANPVQDPYVASVLHEPQSGEEVQVESRSAALGGAVGVLLAGVAALAAAAAARRRQDG